MSDSAAAAVPAETVSARIEVSVPRTIPPLTKKKQQAQQQIGQSYAEFIGSIPHDSWGSALRGFGNPKLPKSDFEPIHWRWSGVPLHRKSSPLRSPTTRGCKSVITFGLPRAATPNQRPPRPPSSLAIPRAIEDKIAKRATSAHRRGGAPRNEIFPRLGAHICGFVCSLPTGPRFHYVNANNSTV